jgi:hypothetical protein
MSAKNSRAPKISLEEADEDMAFEGNSMNMSYQSASKALNPYMQAPQIHHD